MHYTLQDYSFGSVTINGQRHTTDLIICGNNVVSNWQREQGHSLVPDDIALHLPEGTRVLVIGCGAHGMLKVPQKTIDWCRTKNITLIAEPTAIACKTYNTMAHQGNIVAGLHLTC
ncbi:MAG: Mth938-like domain-containing protein [Deltaproteobacteria bacterium]|nr:Mth938-like domain-containing protein [Deltaproteobacteria bacterium]